VVCTSPIKLQGRTAYSNKHPRVVAVRVGVTKPSSVDWHKQRLEIISSEDGIKNVSTQLANSIETVNFTYEMLHENGLSKTIFFQMLLLKIARKECHDFCTKNANACK